MPIFSIIVPVYNAEKTLRKCLDSLRTQTYTDFEVHMVENGSQDSSYAICREYAEEDSRFLLHASKENCGPSGARNIGLDHARGTYIAFLDSDDYVEPEYLEELYHGFREADVVFLGYHQVSVDGDMLADHVPVIKEELDYFETLLQLWQQGVFGYTWSKAFRREMIGNHRFSRDLNLLEDEVFTCEVLTQSCRVAVIPKAILNYVTGNVSSLMGRTHSDYCRKVDAAYTAWQILLDPYEKKAEILTIMANAHVDQCMYYGFERDLDIADFFGALAETAFFRNAKAENKFVDYVRNCNFNRLAWMRTFYRFKTKIAKLLKR